MANKFKYKSSSDNKVTVPFSSIGVDGSGQGSIGTREIYPVIMLELPT